jgi:hypothetical protein
VNSTDDKCSECGRLREALTKILGWREIDRNTLGERLRAIEEIASTALANATSGPGQQCEKSPSGKHDLNSSHMCVFCGEAP